MKKQSQPNLPIRFCINNPRNLAEREMLLVAGYECSGCLGNCTECFESRFLEINDEFVSCEFYEQAIADHRSSNPDSKEDTDPEKADPS